MKHGIICEPAQINVPYFEALLKQMGISKNKLADMSNLSRGTITNLFNHKHLPDIQSMIILKNVLELDEPQFIRIFFPSFVEDQQEKDSAN